MPNEALPFARRLWLSAVCNGGCICDASRETVVVPPHFITFGFVHKDDCPLVLAGVTVQDARDIAHEGA